MKTVDLTNMIIIVAGAAHLGTEMKNTSLITADARPVVHLQGRANLLAEMSPEWNISKSLKTLLLATLDLI